MSQVRFRTFLGLLLALCLVGIMSTSAMGQATISTGAIAGTVADPTGAVVAGAKVVVTNKATGGQAFFVTTGAGTFNSGAIIPGEYAVRVSREGFKTVDVPVTVKIGSVSSVDVKLPVGATGEIVEVAAAVIAVNTEQAVVQGVLTTQQIDSLPINGRNFLDLAQLEPGVQIQDGMNFDPTKGGFTGISVGGRTGRTTRIELDGQDITDETVGTTVANVSQSAIQEFSISQSSLDMSTELTSSGAVQVVSRSGTNSYHGEAFYLFRDRGLAADFPSPSGVKNLPYQRNHEGGRFDGPFIKDKLFFLVNVEHVKQDLASPVNVTVPKPLSGLSGDMKTPFRESMAAARLDWQIKSSARFFYRFNYDNNKGITNYGLAYAGYKNSNNTPAHVWGVDFNNGPWVHSLRVSMLKFTNRIGDPGTPSLFPGALVRVSQFWSGPNYLAPQATFQKNEQAKYDGSRMLGNHNIRYGVGFNRIRGGGFASFFGLSPYISGSSGASGQTYAATHNDFGGGNGNPLNYPISVVEMGNGQGFATELPAFKYPAGGQYDNRFQFYVGDSWKIKPYLTITAGLRYVRDTGRTNSDLDPIPCSDINPAYAPFVTTCKDFILNMEGAGLGKRVRQDNNNFAPNVGFAWDLFHNGKTVVRGGAGLYYENAIFNNVLFSRSLYLKNGLFWGLAAGGNICPSGDVVFPDGSVHNFPFCGQAIGAGAAAAIALQKDYQTATAAAGAAANPSFLGTTMSPYATGGNPIAPNYRTPYSYQMNIGVQHELWEGTVVSADYIRNVNLRFLIAVDTNHVGDARFMNKTVAGQVIAKTNADLGCATVDCAIAAGATMEDYAANGLGGMELLSGSPWYAAGWTGPVAFGGQNHQIGANSQLFPIGRSVYSALQMSMRTRKARPVSFLKNLNFQAAYTLSRFESNFADQDFINSASDNANPTRYFGPTAFDRTHQLSFGLVAEFPKFFRMSLIHHLSSPLPATLSLYNPGDRLGEIFYTDLTGDGTGGDVITQIGNFGRSVSPGSGLVNFVNNFNSKVAGTITPAGKALVDAGLMTESQLKQLGAVVDTIPTPDPKAVGNGWLNTSDLRLAFPIKLRERFTIEPTISFYNVFNVNNYNTNPDRRLSGVMDGSGAGYITAKDDRSGYQAFQSPGMFNFASRRQAELELRITW